jgi:chemotaxis protein histidine kinase CheA
MSGSAGFLEYFVLEASEYVEQLDARLLTSPAATPDGDAILRLARALRGAATMAKLHPFSELAAAVERVGRGLRDRTLAWDLALSGAMIAAVDELKTSLRAVRSWSDADTQRAGLRTAELSRFAPAPTASSATATPAGADARPAGATYLAGEAANLAAGIELFTARPGDGNTAVNVLSRVRALRGVAAVREIAPLAEVLEATEDASRALELSGERLSSQANALLVAAAALLRRVSATLRGGSVADAAASPEHAAFVAAHDAWTGHETERERVVPIEELFYGDGGSGVVQASPNPPTSMAQRFHLELVSQGEHLRGVVEAARAATTAGDAVRISRGRRALHRALRALQAAAASFGDREVASFIAEHADAADHLDFLGLSTLDGLAAVLAQPGINNERLIARLRELKPGRDLATGIGAGLTAPIPADAPRAATPAASAPPVEQPTAAAPPARAPLAPVSSSAPQTLASFAPASAAPTPSPAPRAPAPNLLDATIDALDQLASRPLSEPVAIPEDSIVPIESLLYRGRAALMRAVEIRDEVRRAGGARTVDQAALEELLDLVDLARAE